MTNSISLLELAYKIVHSNLELSQFIVFVVLPLHHCQREVLFPLFAVVGHEKIQSTRVYHQHWHLASYLECSFDGDFIFVELLLS